MSVAFAASGCEPTSAQSSSCIPNKRPTFNTSALLPSSKLAYTAITLFGFIGTSTPQRLLDSTPASASSFHGLGPGIEERLGALNAPPMRLVDCAARPTL